MDIALQGDVTLRNGFPSSRIPQAGHFPFLQLPRELRDQIYNHAFQIPDCRGDRALRIERRHLKYFVPSAASILLLLHHEYLLLNQQVCREALEALLKNHCIFLSCGPYVLKQLLTRIDDHGHPCRPWLRWIGRIELEWVTFPNLRAYPPERSNGRDVWYWEHDGEEVEEDYVTGAHETSHYDEHDYEGGRYYDDNFYEAEDESLYPPWPQAPAMDAGVNDGDDDGDDDEDELSGMASHYPFSDPTARDEPSGDGASAPPSHDTKLDLLISMEVTPLFDYLSTTTFALTSITLPLYFLSKRAHRTRLALAGRGLHRMLPTKLCYWVGVCTHALLMLCRSDRAKGGREHSELVTASHSTDGQHDTTLQRTGEKPKIAPCLQEVRVKYMPWDIWASMDPADDLHGIVEDGVLSFEDDADFDGNMGAADGDEVTQGAAFRAVYAGLRDKGYSPRDGGAGTGAKGSGVKGGLHADVQYVPWEGDLDKWRVGDELLVVFSKIREERQNGSDRIPPVT